MKNKNIKKILIFFFVVIGFSFFINLNSIAEASLTDIEGHKNQNAILFLEENDVVHGNPDSTFRPDNGINRAEILKILFESSDIPLSTPVTQCFPDVPLGEWYSKYVCSAKDLGLLHGYPDGYFRPANNINKVEALKLMANFGGWDLTEALNEELFDDTYEDQWYASYVRYAKMKNLIEFEGNIYNPGGDMLRGEMAESIYRDITVRVLGIDEYSSEYDDQISELGLSWSNITMSQEWNQVAEKVREDILNYLTERDQMVAFMWQEPEKAGTTIGVYSLDDEDGQVDEFVLENDAWLVFVDLYPMAEWEHDTYLIFIDADTFEYSFLQANSWPLIDGIGIWNTLEMREMTEYWVYPKNGDISRLYPDEESVDESISYIEFRGAYAMVASFNNGKMGDKVAVENTENADDTREALRRLQEEREAVLKKLRDEDQVRPKTADNFEDGCKDIPICEKNPSSKKIALVIEGSQSGKTHDAFSWMGIDVNKSLSALGYDTIYLSGLVGENKENFPSDKFPEDTQTYKNKTRYTTIDEVNQAFNDLAAKVNSCCDDVYIVIMGHGTKNGFINLNSKEADFRFVPDPANPGKNKREEFYYGDDRGGRLNTNDLKKLLDKIKSCKVKVLIWSCYSGAHIANGINENYDTKGCLCRTVLTSSSRYRESWGYFWMKEIMAKLTEGKSFKEAAYAGYLKIRDKGWYSNFPEISSTPPVLCDDPDEDGLCTGEENLRGTYHDDADSDDDGLDDGREVGLNLDPLNGDMDKDKLSDGDEIDKYGTDPKMDDTDSDGLSDWHEVVGGTKPTKPDSDDDGCNDGREVLQDHTNPNDPKSRHVECGKTIVEYTGELVIPSVGGEYDSNPVTFGDGDSISVIEISYNTVPKRAWITVNGEDLEVTEGQVIEFDDFEIEIVEISENSVRVKIRPKSS